jgi:HTH-type transcriptional regulator / antitoxin HigA
MRTINNQYYPESVTHPGFTLSEKLNELGMGSKEFAVRTGKPEKTISHILSGEGSITPEMAVLFEDVLHIPAGFWLNRQKQYNEGVARQKRMEDLSAAVEWSKNFPYAEMARLGWVKPTRTPEEKVGYLFQFFSIASPKAFDDYYFGQKLKVNFRISLAHTKRPYSFAAWLRQGEIKARQMTAVSYDARKFESSLFEIKNLMVSHPDDFFQQLQSICMEAGVKVVYTPCLPGASAHGSTRWLGDYPLIQLSARYKQNDIFWFTFFHEAAHILKHGKKFVTLENVDYSLEDREKEDEANQFAIRWTFTEEQEKEVLGQSYLSEESIVAFSKKFNTHPAMIIGRLHHKGHIPYSVGRIFIKPIDLSEN